MNKIPTELIKKISEYTIRENRFNTYNECMKTGKDYFIMYLVFRLYNSEVKRYRNIIKLTKRLKTTMYYN